MARLTPFRADERLMPAAARPVVAEPAPGLEVRGVGHVYRGELGPSRALASIDLTVAAGEFVAILGPSGCGKTTLLRILSGLLEPTEGEVRLGGDPPAAARARQAIGWLAQDDGLLPWRRVIDNVRLPLRLGRHARAQSDAQSDARSDASSTAGSGGPDVALEMLRRVGLEGSARQHPHELSGGMRQRAALARALVADPPFLLLDEPFAHLDELTRERLGDLLLALRFAVAGPRTMPAPFVPSTVLVTHSVAEAVRLADRVIVLSPRPGRVLADLPIDLARPRADDQPGVGRLVRELKRALGVTPTVTATPAFCDTRMTPA